MPALSSFDSSVRAADTALRSGALRRTSAACAALTPSASPPSAASAAASASSTSCGAVLVSGLTGWPLAWLLLLLSVAVLSLM